MNLQRISAISTAALAAVLLSACASSTKLEEPAPVSTAGTGAPSSSSTGAQTQPGTVAPVDARTGESAAAAKAPAQRSVYFDYDSFVIKDEYKSVLEANARFINGAKGQKVVVEGNTDERGGREYNLALGQKRAEAVKQGMTLMGIPESQIEAVSFGKEKPKVQGSNEAAWAENRRSDIAYR
jgi:peptidoglycan-associated lipoprotein